MTDYEINKLWCDCGGYHKQFARALESRVLAERADAATPASSVADVRGDLVAFCELIDDYQIAQLDNSSEDEKASARIALMNAYRSAADSNSVADTAGAKRKFDMPLFAYNELRSHGWTDSQIEFQLRKDAPPAPSVADDSTVPLETVISEFEAKHGPIPHVSVSSVANAAGAKPWIERWHGSHPQRGWSIVQGRDVVAYIGGDESMSDSVSAIVKAHNDCFDCGGTGCTMNCSGLHNVDCAGQSFSTEGQSGDLAAMEREND